MSDENKDFRDDLNEMLGDAKDGARKAAEKAEELAREAKEKATEFAGEAKEKVGDFAGEAKEAAKEFAHDAKEVLSDGKNVGIVAHLTIIGWLIAVVMNSSNRTEFASFYIRQVLGIYLLALLSWIPLLGWFVGVICLILWVMSLIGAISGEKKPIFLFGDKFQEWFKTL